jgi:D-alanyl-D-alanine carboxypeptidase
VADRATHRPHIVFARARVRLGLLIALLFALTVMLAIPARAAPFAATVMDARTGEILYSTNDTTRLHPASLTKMMTLYVVFEAIRNGELSLDTRVVISRRAAREPPSRLGLREGQRIAVRHLIRAAALRSGNDAATALAEAVSGSVEAFARRMNRTAAAIGMNQTTFRNAHGLTQAGHISSARDMTILGRQLYFDFPEYYSLFSRRSEDAGIATVANTNSRFLDGYPGADGIKTGFTSAAGYNLTAMAERNGVRIIVTVFGGRSIAHRHEMVVQLMNRGFRAAPSRAAVRRPARPDYQRQPQRQAAPEATVAAAPQGSRAAGRVIRLQTAPARSIFPQPRPGPEAAPVPSEALLAAVQQGIEAALAPVPTPPPAAAVAQALAEAAAAAPAQPEAIADAPGRSPLPPPRPVEVSAVAQATDPMQAPGPDEVQAARAAGFSVIDPETYAALTEADDILPEGPAAPAPAQPVAAPLPAPPIRPLDMVAAAEAGPDHGSLPVTMAPEGTGTLASAEVRVEEGLVVIPGLPPIAMSDGGVEMPEPPDPATTLAEPVVVAQSRSEPALVVTAQGQVLWHDEDILTAFEEIAPAVGPRAVMLTAVDAPAPAPVPVMPEVVVRVATSGGQLWAVDLGTFGSRFDAERTLLRVALSESAVLGSGVRRVEERGARHRALVMSLSEDQASLACQRLALTAQPCEVVAP